ncbi:acetyl-CoA decarbonylase/synthase complex subunit gamma [Thermodesulfovibrio sp. 1176]|uniref:acetyl-CoA decarbonylase/synthase complex subunit gamma n=1 Tax=Thermodesulfovibrio sp. 1176 TaxID=3043424 RepID=UPI0024830791|nr:acetyl-CoA decarbonylase/synthase complex subunit gamma [Thermodesulfovibrio sp. 1176]MDI1472298.1 acetyl-CoA decarbonylase/synthase complex subunit gamma [Thermodesulfovibrio sp. 1176]
MALTGIEIFKLLPKTNCKKCGFPTCLAFAMKVAQSQAEIEQCPEASEEVKAKLKEAATPPIRGIIFGPKNNFIKIGEEQCLYRHEKKFFHPTVLALRIKDTDENIEEQVNKILDSQIERVGEFLKIDAVFLENESNNPQKFKEAVEKIIKKAEIPIIFGTFNPESVEQSLPLLSNNRPILYGANEKNVNQMTSLAKKYNVPLTVTAYGIQNVISIVERIQNLGFEDILIDTQPNSARELLIDNTLIRRASLKKRVKAVGYPIFTFIKEKESFYETVLASVAILKYSSIVVLNEIPKWKNLILFTLRQNIYSDPQVPMQVKEDIYKVGEPDENSPLIVTTNFALTYFLVKGEIENSKVPTWLAIMDCDGLSVLTAWAAGKFSASKIAQFIKESGIEQKLAHRELIIPGYVAMLKSAIEDKLPGWKVIIGTKEASAIPAFLKNYVRSKV